VQHARQDDIVGEARLAGDLGAAVDLRRALPMTFMFQPARGFLDRLEDLLIPGAAAKVA